MKKLAPLFLASLFAFASCGKKKEEPKATTETKTEAAAENKVEQAVSEIDNKISELKAVVEKIKPLLDKIKGGDATVTAELETLSKQADEIEKYLKTQTLSAEQQATVNSIMSVFN